MTNDEKIKRLFTVIYSIADEISQMEIEKMCDEVRYSNVLEALLNRLKVKSVLALDYESGYQGHVDISALLEDGRVFSYKYWYGSCSGCDDWECLSLSSEQIEKEMEQEATFFESVESYGRWIEMKKNPARKCDLI